VLTDALVGQKSDILRTLGNGVAFDWQTFFNERAGIAEFDGYALGAEAERQAYECCTDEWLNRNPEAAVPGQCAKCRQAHRPDHIVVPFGTEKPRLASSGVLAGTKSSPLSPDEHRTSLARPQRRNAEMGMNSRHETEKRDQASRAS
jgi:hypothetical protein